MKSTVQEVSKIKSFSQSRLSSLNQSESINYDIRMVSGFMPTVFTWWSLSLMEKVKVRVSMFHVNNEETITTMSTRFWFLMVKFELVSNVILLHLLKRKLLLAILKVEVLNDNNRNKDLDKQRHIQNLMRHLGWSFLKKQLKGTQPLIIFEKTH